MSQYLPLSKSPQCVRSKHMYPCGKHNGEKTVKETAADVVSTQRRKTQAIDRERSKDGEWTYLIWKILVTSWAPFHFLKKGKS